jgi:hypothetical protein
MKKREIDAAKQIRAEIERATAANDIEELEMLHGELACVLMHSKSKLARKIAAKLLDPELAERDAQRGDEEAERLAEQGAVPSMPIG